MGESRKAVALGGLLTVVALCAIALWAPSSYGAIEYQRCAKVLEKETGNYTESKCLTADATRKSEWIRARFPGNVLNATEECAETVESGLGMWKRENCTELEEHGNWVRLALGSGAFTGTSGVSRLVAGTNTVRCVADTSSGSLSGSNAISKLVVKYKSCKLESLEIVTCNTPGSAPGEVETASLRGKLGYVEVLGKKVGVLLKPEVGEEFTKGEVTCALNKVKLKGSLIGEVTPINTFSNKSTQSFKIVEGKQQWTEIQIEGLPQTAKLEYSLNGGPFGIALAETVEELALAENFAIKA